MDYLVALLLVLVLLILIFSIFRLRIEYGLSADVFDILLLVIGIASCVIYIFLTLCF